MFKRWIQPLRNRLARRRLRALERRRPRHARPMFETLEGRTLMSAAVLTADNPQFVFHDADGDVISIDYSGSGTIEVTLESDAADNADIHLIEKIGNESNGSLAIAMIKMNGAGVLIIGSIFVPGDEVTINSLHDITATGTIQTEALAIDGPGITTIGADGGNSDVIILPADADGFGTGSGSVTISSSSDLSGGYITYALVGSINGESERPPRSHSYTFTDADGDIVTVKLKSEGELNVRFDNGVTDNADIATIDVIATNPKGTLDVKVKMAGGGDGKTTIGGITVGGSLKSINLKNVTVDGDGVEVDGSLGSFVADALINGADLLVEEAGAKPVSVDLLATTGLDNNKVVILLPGDAKLVRIRGDMTLTEIAAGGDVKTFDVYGSMSDSAMLAGATLNEAFNLKLGDYASAIIKSARIRGDMIDSILAAGGDPGSDGLFANGEVLNGGQIAKLTIDGRVVGADSPHINPGVYASLLGKVKINGLKLTLKSISAGLGVLGNAVIDPLPLPGNALTAAEVESIIEQMIARAEQLGVAATIAVMDREGNPLGIVRMDGAEEFVDIDAGGERGLEAVDDIVKTSLIAATKAGTAAFLSTSMGNAFTTRTAGQIIQTHFPPGTEQQDAGPLFGVQLSSLPTSDVNRLPLGLSADPGGIPIYRNGELIGGIGVEVDGIYTIDASGVGGNATVEELIALAGQIGLEPPKNIQAGNIFVDGIRLDYANSKPPKLSSLGVLPDLSDPDITVLLAPTVSPGSKFATAMLGAGADAIVGEVPDNALNDFFVGGAVTFLDGDEGAPGINLTAADVETILTQAHELNARLRAQIRRDDPQVSQVTVSVVDLNGNLLGSFRTPDAPVFGYDVSVQKARTAAFFSRPDAGAELAGLDVDLAAGIAAAKLLGIIDPLLPDPFGSRVDAAAALGVLLDGSVAVSDRAGGFLARPNLPDGIGGASPGPFSADSTEAFSAFNTGLQTILMIPNLVGFLVAFNALPEGAALAAFFGGAISGPGSVPNVDGAGIGLPGNSLANGMQIFAGSVPLYKDGVLVGAVGVSGDGIEQDDYISFAGAEGFQEFGPGVVRSDSVVLPGGIRLPYVKLPRSPFAGV